MYGERYLVYSGTRSSNGVLATIHWSIAVPLIGAESVCNTSVTRGVIWATTLPTDDWMT